MKNRILLLLILSITTLACNDEFNTPHDCILSSGVEGSNWFQEYTALFEDDTTGYWYMYVGSYKLQTVFLPGNCCPNCSTVPVVLNCQGEQIGIIGNEIDADDIEYHEVIWRSPNFSCNL